MQPLVDHATALASLDSIATAVASTKAALVPMDNGTAFAVGLDAIKKDGQPPMFDMMLSCVGGLHYEDMLAGLPAFVAQLAIEGKIPAPVDPAILVRLGEDARDCDANKLPYARLGQSIRDLFETPGLKEAMGIA